jgi:hypothetical protein
MLLAADVRSAPMHPGAVLALSTGIGFGIERARRQPGRCDPCWPAGARNWDLMTIWVPD